MRLHGYILVTQEKMYVFKGMFASQINTPKPSERYILHEMENIVTVVVADIDVGIILEKLLYHSVHFSGENSDTL